MQVLKQKMGSRLSAYGTALLLLMIPGVGSADSLPEPGQQSYEMNCAVCHGIDGTPALPMAPHFAKGERMEKTDVQLLTSVVEGLNVMPPWRGVLSEDVIKEILTYVRSLSK